MRRERGRGGESNGHGARQRRSQAHLRLPFIITASWTLCLYLPYSLASLRIASTSSPVDHSLAVSRMIVHSLPSANLVASLHSFVFIPIY